MAFSPLQARHFVGRLNAAEVDDDDEVPMLSQNVKRQVIETLNIKGNMSI